LADEPTGNLDDRNSQQVVAELIRLAKANNTALLMVTHSSKVATSMDKIYQLKDNGISLTTNTSAISATD
jgi:putative ABC transport system ATP-binding protein